MPFTLSHPAAILPFSRLTPRWLSFAALFIGSMTPDVAYFFPRFHSSAYAHTFAGSVFFDLPVGMAIYFIFILFREPLCRMLPSPHREALLPLVQKKTAWNISRILFVGVSVQIGVWTHVVWDSFTHVHGFFVQTIPVLSRIIFVFDGVAIPGYWIAQQVSTFAGLAALFIAYFLWLRRKGVKNLFQWRMDGKRYALWGAVIILPMILSSLCTKHLIWPQANFTVWYSALCRFALYYIGFLFFVLLFLSIASHWLPKKEPGPDGPG